MMWTKPWNMKEGFLIGGGLIIAGLALELSVGPIIWEAFAWPANGMVLAGFLLMIAMMFLLRKKVYAFQFVGTYQAAIPAMVYAVVLTIIMGLIRQKVGGTWLNDMLSFWPFVLIYVYITAILGVIILRRVTHLSSWKRDLPFLLNHLGLFIALTTATLGNADMQRVKMICGGSHYRDAYCHRTEEVYYGDLRRWLSQTFCLRDSDRDEDVQIHRDHRGCEQTLRGGWLEDLSVWLRHTDGCSESDIHLRTGE